MKRKHTKQKKKKSSNPTTATKPWGKWIERMKRQVKENAVLKIKTKKTKKRSKFEIETETGSFFIAISSNHVLSYLRVPELMFSIKI